MKKINYSILPMFEKEFSRLSKKYKTLPEDFEKAKINAIELFHIKELDNRSTFLIPGFLHDNIKIYKLKKFACRSLKGKGNRSGIRVIYAFCPERGSVEFIEIYIKSDNKKSEDRDRIKAYLKNNYGK